jgi:hypothetical protein
VTSTVTKVTARVIESGSEAASAAVVAIVLLIALLVLYQLVQVLGGPLASRRQAALRVAIAPLLIVFVMVLTTRLADVLESS